MNRWKKAAWRLLCPPVWVMIVLSVICTALLITVFVLNRVSNPVSYGIFALSAYTLTAVTVFFIKTFPSYYKSLKQKFFTHPYGNKYMTDAEYRVRLSLYISLGINLIYSVFKMISGVIYSSSWMVAIAVYYVVLSVIRFLLLRYMRSGKQDIMSEWKRYRLCGIFMVLLNLSLSGIVFHMVWQNESYSYPEIVVIAVATYTFYSVAMSGKDIIKYRKYNSPVLSAAKALRFAAALVSLLTLETAMLALYGEDEAFRRLMVALTGTGVCIIVLGISVYMIVRSYRAIKINKT